MQLGDYFAMKRWAVVQYSSGLRDTSTYDHPRNSKNHWSEPGQRIWWDLGSTPKVDDEGGNLNVVVSW